MHFALATDRAFVRQTAVAVASIARAHPDRDATVHLLHDGIDETARRVIAVSARHLDVEWVDARHETLEQARRPGDLSVASLFRLRVGELLAELDRAVYLDADTLVLSPLDELWATDLGDAPVAAVVDIGHPHVAGILPWRDLELAPDTPYFNSGVLVIALDRWRECDIGSRAMTSMRQHSFRHADQCALNAACRGSFRRLAPRWNVQRGHFWPDGPPWAIEGVCRMTEALEHPAIMHFCRPRWNRPWLAECDHPYRDEWYRMLAATPFAGSDLPPRDRRATVRRYLATLRRALVTDPDAPPW